jgi:hypothetical protein
MSATRSAIKELEEHGYLIRRPIRENGRIKDWEYIIFECPQQKNQEQELPVVENQQVENQQTENHTQLNTNQLNTNLSSKKELNNIPADIPAEFENLWKIYPRKEGKKKAFSAYEKARKKGVSFADVEQGIKNYIKYIEINHTEKAYIKHGSTWFGGECWSDEYDFTPPPEKASYKPNNYTEIREINGKKYEYRNGKYYIPNGNGISVDPYAKTDLF